MSENGYSRVLNAYTNTTNMEWGGGGERKGNHNSLKVQLTYFLGN